jgi:hypothetical protein
MLVESKAISQIEYDAEAEVLFVEFHVRGWYAYGGVPASVHDELVTARSIGAYFNRKIRNVYPETKIVSFVPQELGSARPSSSHRHP